MVAISLILSTRSRLVIHQPCLKIKTEPSNPYSSPVNSFYGCYYNLNVSPDLKFSVVLEPQISGYEIMRLCQDIAVTHDATFYALQNSNTCLYGNKKEYFIKDNHSLQCDSVCGTDLPSRGMSCGGSSSNPHPSNSVFQISVRSYWSNIYFRNTLEEFTGLIITFLRLVITNTSTEDVILTLHWIQIHPIHLL